jgi:hypothetical protein
LAIALALSVSAEAQTTLVYDSLGNGQSFVAGGATAQMPLTNVIVDDLQTTGGVGFPVRQISCDVINLNVSTVSVEIGFFFWAADGLNGGPGTFLGGAIHGMPFFFGPGEVQTVPISNPGITFAVPDDGTLWAGIYFGNSVGASATVDQLNHFGLIIHNPVIGTSSDKAFQTASHAFGGNPPGSFFDFGGNPQANFAWNVLVDVPESSTTSLIAAGVLLLLTLAINAQRGQRQSASAPPSSGRDRLN